MRTMWRGRRVVAVALGVVVAVTVPVGVASAYWTTSTETTIDIDAAPFEHTVTGGSAVTAELELTDVETYTYAATAYVAFTVTSVAGGPVPAADAGSVTLSAEAVTAGATVRTTTVPSTGDCATADYTAGAQALVGDSDSALLCAEVTVPDIPDGQAEATYSLTWAPEFTLGTWTSTPTEVTRDFTIPAAGLPSATLIACDDDGGSIWSLPADIPASAGAIVQVDFADYGFWGTMSGGVVLSAGVDETVMFDWSPLALSLLFPTRLHDEPVSRSAVIAEYVDGKPFAVATVVMTAQWSDAEGKAVLVCPE